MLTVRLLSIVLMAGLLAACSSDVPLLDRIRASGELRVITYNSPTTYYLGSEGPAGFEFDLVKLFADSIGVRPKLIVVEKSNEIIPRIARAEAHLAAAGLTITAGRKLLVRFAPPVQHVMQQLIYRSGTRRPRAPQDLVDRYIEVVSGSSHVARLVSLKADYPELRWIETQDLSVEELLYLVWEKVIECTVANSNLVAVVRRFYPELRVAFDLAEPQPLAWAFPRSADTSLYDAAARFIEQAEKEGVLAQLWERYYGHVQRFDYVGTRTFRRHVAERLPRWRPFFEKAAAEHGLDWRLLAAVGYQESHWNPEAVSPTGVRGIMMLTQATARQVGIRKRTDPEQSIAGGARYLARVKRRIPDRIAEPERTWLALAAYNLGFGHLKDALALTRMRGGDADRWVDVKDTLPLLNQEEWYAQTRYGYAWGREAVRYVENIRSYYDILVWALCRESEPVSESSALAIAAPAL